MKRAARKHLCGPVTGRSRTLLRQRTAYGSATRVDLGLTGFVERDDVVFLGRAAFHSW